MLRIFCLIIFIFLSLPAKAYLGPGMGAGIILATLGFVVAIFAALFAIVWFPIKRLFKKNKQNKNKK